MELGKLRICTDAQDYMVNWPTKKLRKTIQFRALASSCLRTGYVFACHSHLDARFNTLEVQEAIEACGDLEKKPAFRQYARLWSYEDYGRALELGENYFGPAREDQDSPEHITEDRQLPDQRALVHVDYLHGHFRYLYYHTSRTTGGASLKASVLIASAPRR